MKFGNLVVLGVFLSTIGMAGQFPTSAQDKSSGDAAIKERLDGFIKAYNSRNAASLSEFFTDNARLIDVQNKVIQGKAEIGKQFAAGFAVSSNYTLESVIESIRYISDDVAQIEGVSTLKAPNEAAIVNRFTTLALKKDQVWKLAEIRDLPSAAEDVLPADRLTELEWMIGDWGDQKGTLKIHSSVNWGEKKAYLTRTTTVNSGEENSFSSLMVLCWDAQSGQIRSWQFDSNGGRGEAVWNRASDDAWIIHATGSQSDGSPNAATQIVTVVGKDSFKTRSYDRIIGGQVAPDIDEIMMVRKAPVAGVAAPAAGSAKTAAPAAPTTKPANAPVKLPGR